MLAEKGENLHFDKGYDASSGILCSPMRRGSGGEDPHVPGPGEHEADGPSQESVSTWNCFAPSPYDSLRCRFRVGLNQQRIAPITNTSLPFRATEQVPRALLNLPGV